MAYTARISQQDGRRYCSRNHAARLLGRSAPVVNDLVARGFLSLHRVGGKDLVALDELFALKDKLFCGECGQRLPDEVTHGTP